MIPIHKLVRLNNAQINNRLSAIIYPNDSTIINFTNNINEFERLILPVLIERDILNKFLANLLLYQLTSLEDYGRILSIISLKMLMEG